MNRTIIRKNNNKKSRSALASALRTVV